MGSDSVERTLPADPIGAGDAVPSGFREPQFLVSIGGPLTA